MNLQRSPSLPLTLAAVAAVLLAVPVTVETLVEGLGDSGGGHALFAATQLIAWALLLRVCTTLRHTGTDRRALGIGSAVTVAGCMLQLVFALSYAVSAAVLGTPHGAVFVPFSLGFLALTVGGLTWGLALRRRSQGGRAALGLVLVALLGITAVTVGQDPWHDIALISSYLAWVLVGHGTARLAGTEDRREAPGTTAGAAPDEHLRAAQG